MNRSNRPTQRMKRPLWQLDIPKVWLCIRYWKQPGKTVHETTGLITRPGKWLQNCSKMVPKWPPLDQVGPSWTKLARGWPIVGPKVAGGSPRWLEYCESWPQNRSRMAQVGAKIGPWEPKYAPRWLHVCPSWPQDGRSWAKDGPK